MPPSALGHGTKQKSAKYTSKSRKHFRISLISLRVEVAQISNFLVHAKILPL